MSIFAPLSRRTTQTYAKLKRFIDVCIEHKR
jgi:hypothetical protein